MAKRTVKKKMAKKAAKRAAPKATSRGKASRKMAPRKKAASRRAPRREAGSAPRPPKIRPGTITHTELASADPEATKAWCARVLGWQFGESVPTPAGPYHMWRFSNGTGGGIRANNPPEGPGSIPYCEVEDIHATFAEALAAGANEMLAPQALPSGMGWIAIVAAPGGVPIGFWAMK